MKRIFTLLALFTMVLGAMAQTSGIMLSYNKGQQLKFFRSNQLMDAINAAEVNDTLYFSNGTFDFNQLPTINDDYYAKEWSKPLVVIGTGAQEDKGTYVSMPGTLYLKFDETIPVSQRNMSFEGIHIPNWVCPASEINELSFINFKGDFYDRNDLIQRPSDAEEDWQKPHTYINKLKFDRCQMSSINLQEENVINCQVQNSIIGSEVNGRCSIDPVKGGQSFSLNHCRIENVNGEFEGFIQKSLIKYDRSNGGSYIDSCGIHNSDNNSNRTNVVTLNWYNDTNNKDEIPTSSDGSIDLADGSKMGLTSDYSLLPSYPTVDSAKSEIDFDGINGNVNISIVVLEENKDTNN